MEYNQLGAATENKSISKSTQDGNSEISVHHFDVWRDNYLQPAQMLIMRWKPCRDGTARNITHNSQKVLARALLGI
jgi:hypothetical protein